MHFYKLICAAHTGTDVSLRDIGIVLCKKTILKSRASNNSSTIFAPDLTAEGDSRKVHPQHHRSVTCAAFWNAAHTKVYLQKHNILFTIL